MKIKTKCKNQESHQNIGVKIQIVEQKNSQFWPFYAQKFKFETKPHFGTKIQIDNFSSTCINFNFLTKNELLRQCELGF